MPEDDKTPYITPNLRRSIIENGYTFKGFAQSMPSCWFSRMPLPEKRYNRWNRLCKKTCTLGETGREIKRIIYPLRKPANDSIS